MVICFSFEVDEFSKLPIMSRWDNLADNPGGELAWFTFFFFGVVSFGKDCAVLTGKSPDADVVTDDNVEPDADADNNDGGNNNAAADNAADGNNNDEKDSDNDDNCRFDSNDVFFFVSAPLLFDLPFLTSFVGVTIEIDGLHLLERLASDGV